MTTVSLDGISSSTIPELVIENVSRQITPTLRDSYRDVPGRAGSWLFEEAAGDRTLSIQFAAVGDTLPERRSALREAATWLYGDGLGLRKLIVDDEPDRFVWAKLVGQIDAEELLARGRFAAAFRTSPFALSNAVQAQTIAGVGIGWTDTITADTIGVAAELLPSVEVTATADASYFAFNANGKTIFYGDPITTGEKFTVSTISATVTTGVDLDTELEGYFDPAALAMTSVSGDFPLLVPGGNLVTGQGPISLAFRWRTPYV